MGVRMRRVGHAARCGVPRELYALRPICRRVVSGIGGGMVVGCGYDRGWVQLPL